MTLPTFINSLGGEGVVVEATDGRQRHRGSWPPLAPPMAV